MIIFSRWGFFVLLFAGLGAGVGFGLKALFTGSPDSDATYFNGLGLVLGGVGLYFFSRYVIEAHLDKPQPVTITQKLAQPYVHPDGRTQTYTTFPAVNPQTGQPIWRRPRSTLFFIPVRIWSYILGGIGLLVFLGSLIGSAVSSVR